MNKDIEIDIDKRRKRYLLHTNCITQYVQYPIFGKKFKGVYKWHNNGIMDTVEVSYHKTKNAFKSTHYRNGQLKYFAHYKQWRLCMPIIEWDKDGIQGYWH